MTTKCLCWILFFTRRSVRSRGWDSRWSFVQIGYIL